MKNQKDQSCVALVPATRITIDRSVRQMDSARSPQRPHIVFAPKGFGKTSFVRAVTGSFDKVTWVSDVSGLKGKLPTLLKAEDPDALVIAGWSLEASLPDTPSSALSTAREKAQHECKELDDLLGIIGSHAKHDCAVYVITEDLHTSKPALKPWKVIGANDLLLTEEEVSAYIESHSRDERFRDSTPQHISKEVLSISAGIPSIVSLALEEWPCVQNAAEARLDMFCALLGNTKGSRLREALVTMLLLGTDHLECLTLLGIPVPMVRTNDERILADLSGLDLENTVLSNRARRVLDLPTSRFDEVASFLVSKPALLADIVGVLASWGRLSRATHLLLAYATSRELLEWIELRGDELLETREYDLLDRISSRLSASEQAGNATFLLLSGRIAQQKGEEAEKIIGLASSAFRSTNDPAIQTRALLLKLHALRADGRDGSEIEETYKAARSCFEYLTAIEDGTRRVIPGMRRLSTAEIEDLRSSLLEEASPCSEEKALGPIKTKSDPAKRDLLSIEVPPPMIDIPQGALRVKLFGSFEMTNGEITVYGEDWDKRKSLMLFCSLILNKGKESSRELLLERFWPDMDTDRAKNNFYVTLTSLRRMLSRFGDPAEYLKHRNGVCRIDMSNVVSDVNEFERIYARVVSLEEQESPRELLELYRRMQYLYRGELLAGITDTSSYFTGIKILFHDKMLQSMVHGSEIALALGDAKLALWFAQQAAEHDGGREEVYRTLIRAQMAGGQRGSALETFHRCRTYLSDELGIDPSSETMELYSELLAMDHGRTKAEERLSRTQRGV